MLRNIFTLFILYFIVIEAYSQESVDQTVFKTDTVVSVQLNKNFAVSLTQELIKIRSAAKVDVFLIESSEDFFLTNDTTASILLNKISSLRILNHPDSINGIYALGNGNQQVSISALYKDRADSSILSFFTEEGLRERVHYTEAILIVSFLLLIVLVLLKLNFSNRFYQIFSLNRLFSLRPKEGDTNRMRLFDQGGVWVALFYLLAMGLVSSMYFEFESFQKDNGTFHMFKYIFIHILGVLGLFALKILLVYVSSFIFRLSKINIFFIKEMMNLNMVFVSLLWLIAIAYLLFNASLSVNILAFLKVMVVVFYLLRMILMYFKILKLSGFTNVYLFSYFCTTEIFPLIIGLKYFY